MEWQRPLRLAFNFFAAAAAFFWASAAVKSCDTWVALSDATTDHSVILAKNSDRPPMEAQPLVQVPRQEHAPGATVQCTYVTIPQVAETSECIGSKPWWLFGYEHGMNEHGVAIGNEAVWSKEPYQWKDGLLGMDLLRLALERGATAYQAMHVITELLETYGQCGDCEHEGEWGKANYHNSFLIADPKEAWVLETAGRYWVAKRIAKSVYSISNIYSIETQWDEAHPNLVRHAVEMGWSKSPQDFNFARDYGDYGSNAKNPGDMQNRRNTTLGCLRQDCPGVSVASMMRISRSHHEGTILEPRWSAADTFWSMPCMHDSPRAPYRTNASMVAHLRADRLPLLRQVYWASFCNPCCGVFQPFYLHGCKVPESYARGTNRYSADSPWWQAARVKLLCDLNYQALNPEVRKVFDATEQRAMARQQQAEAEALRLLGDDRQGPAMERLQRLVDEDCARIQQEYKMLNETLPRTLNKIGVRYLYADYLKGWVSKTGVPLVDF